MSSAGSLTKCPQAVLTTTSCWKADLRTCTTASQTYGFSSSDECTQFPDLSSTGVQTEGRTANCQTGSPSAASPSLVQFVRRGATITKKAVEESVRDEKEWKAMRKVMASGCETAVQTHQIYVQDCMSSGERESCTERESGDLVPSVIEWNCNSSTLVLALKSGKEHDSWCSHESSLLFFSLYRSYDRHSVPCLTLPVPCITALKSHPTVGTVYALATHSGNILLLDTRDYSTDGKTWIRVSNPDQPHHEHSVTYLHWIPGGTESESTLVSMGSDGRIFQWQLNLTEKSDFLVPLRAFAVSTTDLGRSSHTGKTGTRSEVGIAASSFSWDQEQKFVIGCLGGAVLLCRLDPDLEFSGTQDLSFRSPVLMAYAPHRSSVTSVQFCRKHRNLFFSASDDGEVRVFNSLDSKPVALLHVQCDRSATFFWSHQKLVIFFLGSRGAIRSIALSRDQSRLSLITTPFLAPDQQEVCNLWPNEYESRGDELALLSDRGDVCVWRVGAFSCSN